MNVDISPARKYVFPFRWESGQVCAIWCLGDKNIFSIWYTMTSLLISSFFILFVFADIVGLMRWIFGALLRRLDC